ncbi:hypothetical protein DUNSADRAFT_817 [Dunaliella salina]|uniref:Uncharacterized protein n=1 Tax=Dunaliella salina TaxID=3046 RepID=A0ABQ7GXT6_DUNSA|nr:hypothetical protein DUNSADRAFT_817 [Dunaliella salina]|eukprot:KAF5839415.1 hypothetical protein DUNSADRAFT_817 [Dunaliella salina]
MGLLYMIGSEGTKKRALLDGPPPGYDFRATTSAATRAVVLQEYPQLLPLVDRGVLVLWQRSSGYVERREDGYREPERVFIVATAHVSSQSAADVDQVIQAVRPENVVVELCRSRTAAMVDSDQHQEQQQPKQQQPFVLSMGSSGSSGSNSGDGSSDSNGAHLGRGSDGGSSQGAVQLPPPNATEELDSPQGSGTSNALGVGVAGRNLLSLSGSSSDGGMLGALQRSASLGGQSGLLLRLLLSSLTKRTAGALGVRGGGEFLAARRAAEAVEAQLIAPLIRERDVYLAWSLKRSKAVNGTRQVVGVVGAGHVKGVVWALEQDAGGDTLRFSDLVSNKNKRRSKQQQQAEAVGRLALELVLGAALYWAWLQYRGEA